MRNFNWVLAPLLGAVVTFLLNGAFSILIFQGELFGGTYWTYSTNFLRVVLLTSLPLAAHLAGGLASGALALSSPGSSGALSAILSALVAVVRALGGLLYFYVLNPSPDVVPFSEDMGLLSMIAVLFAAYFPLTVLTGYLGGRLGGGLWSNNIVARTINS